MSISKRIYMLSRGIGVSERDLLNRDEEYNPFVHEKRNNEGVAS